MSKRLALFGTLIPVVGLVLGFASAPAGVADARSSASNRLSDARPPISTETTLSPYWSSKVQRWSSLIVQEAQRRNLDPDLLASLVWMESRGDAGAVGPVGAVGLMQIMPKEAGFSWRPSENDLLDPETNLFWGTRTLATVIRQGQGDIFNALAAYNGGWDQIMYRGPKSFATAILRDYARAVATREGLGGTWSAFFAVQDATLHGPIWVYDSNGADVYFYSDKNATPEGGQLIPDVAATGTVANCYDDASGAVFAVGIWLYAPDQQAWVTAGAVPALEARIQSMVTSPSIMAGSARPGSATPAAQIADTAPVLAPDAQTSSEPTVAAEEAAPVVAAPTEAFVEATPPQTSDSPPQTSDSPPQTSDSPPQTSDSPPQTPESTEAGDVPVSGTVDALDAGEGTPTDVPPVPCAGGPVEVDAWPLERVNTPDGGWKARIFAEGRGGNCTYTYAWNDLSDIRGEGMHGPITFEVTSSRRASVIVGTVVVTSGRETTRVALYIHPPGD